MSLLDQFLFKICLSISIMHHLAVLHYMSWHWCLLVDTICFASFVGLKWIKFSLQPNSYSRLPMRTCVGKPWFFFIWERIVQSLILVLKFFQLVCAQCCYAMNFYIYIYQYCGFIFSFVMAADEALELQAIKKCCKVSFCPVLEVSIILFAVRFHIFFFFCPCQMTFDTNRLCAGFSSKWNFLLRD